jgi:hypothetical protein
MTFKMQCVYTFMIIFSGSFAATASTASEFKFVCQWQISEPPYEVEFVVYDTSRTVERSDSLDKYKLLAISDFAVWISPSTRASRTLVVQTIERSPVGGNWTDVWLLSSGQANETIGGYCVEKNT